MTEAQRLAKARREAKALSKMRSILEYVIKRPNCTAPNIAFHVGLSVAATRQYLSKLEVQGEVLRYRINRNYTMFRYKTVEKPTYQHIPVFDECPTSDFGWLYQKFT